MTFCASVLTSTWVPFTVCHVSASFQRFHLNVLQKSNSLPEKWDWCSRSYTAVWPLIRLRSGLLCGAALCSGTLSGRNRKKTNTNCWFRAGRTLLSKISLYAAEKTHWSLSHTKKQSEDGQRLQEKWMFTVSRKNHMQENQKQQKLDLKKTHGTNNVQQKPSSDNKICNKTEA